ncbi:YbaB/EbfC family nucleoid-associated protein [Nonomuraea zeae]|uniref:YbaB/EbfC family nucleoid-associated protein n=1 Tax=Nonomuraea zeae TaxID=1642303 RepID=A0A5S4FW00_9ACTN|nr:YbaB/EbfC family nucleoid-associated protein [Nonomuraea zeae]TMR24833.1 YbaB/EbfC family nucleoid-associated protein [Nonomuraea zeae]
MKHDDAADARLPEMLREVGRMADAFAGEAREAEERRVTGADRTGQVTATVSGSARLLDVRIGARAMRDLDHVELSQAVLEAVGAAREAAAEELTEVLGRLNGGGRPQPGARGHPSARDLDAMLREAGHG